MKQSQWIGAALALALTVFFVTFAMNYLGEGGRGLRTPTNTRQPQHEVLFFWRTSPAAGQAFEYEAHVPGYQDFWFRNDNPDAVKVGLFKKGCTCTSVDLFYLSEDGPRRLIADAVALLGTAMNGPLASPGALSSPYPDAPIKPTVTLSALTLHALSMPELQKGAVGPHHLLGIADSVSVPGGAVGWVRMHWNAQRLGPQRLNADLWMDDLSGNRPTLETHVRIHEPIRVQPMLALGVLRDEDLAGGVTRDILCWSSTRTSLRLRTQTSQSRDTASETFLVGMPVPMTPAELQNLEKQNAQEGPANTGPVLCGYRIPVTLKGMAADGKTPFDLGPFLRRVTVSSPDVSVGEPKQVTITGRVRGDIEIGNDENGEINFSTFPGRTGKRVPISLQSDVPGLTLTFDRERTKRFLDAVLSKPELVKGGTRQVWSLRAEVLPGKMWGVFPRREDPLYEDSAIYLKAVVPGKPPRSVRIAVQGTANQS